MRDLFEAADGYDPCDPDSQPPRELKDMILEPVDIWNLDHGSISQDTFEDALDLWMDIGDSVLKDETPMEESPHPNMDPGAIRIASPQSVAEFCEDLRPLIMESVGLAAIPLDVLLATETRPVILGQMFGVPRADGYVPVLVLETTVHSGIEHAVHQMHGFFHLMDDTFSEDPEEVGILL